MARTFLLAVTVIASTLMVMTGCQRQTVSDTGSDISLAQAVRDRLATNQNTKGATSWARVEAKDGEVTLSGTVDNNADKALAEQIARGTNGVKAVINRITISEPVLPLPDEPFEEQKVRDEASEGGERIGPSSEDARIYHAVRRQIVRLESTPKRSIFVDVEDGDVTLRGMISTTVARDEAVRAARAVEGTKAVRDRLLINTSMP